VDANPFAPVPLEPRRASARTRRFHRGTHPPFAIRWFGASALVGHLRHLVAVAAASNQLDLRDWMRPDEPEVLLDRVSAVLDARGGGPSLAERLEREVWIDFVADTGDDHDLSVAVARLVAAEYVTTSENPRTLPRGDLLIFGGDTAYPASTAAEILRRLVRPWNRVLRARADGKTRVLLAIPGNHDWYDALDGFGRLFRRRVGEDDRDPAGRTDPAPRPADPVARTVGGALQRQLHVDEVNESLRLAKQAAESVGALLGGSKVRRERRLALIGYTPVQESSYWALPLAQDLDVWGVDRQLRNADFRQRVFFGQCRAGSGSDRLMVIAPDPVFAFGEPNQPGRRLLASLSLSLSSHELLYLTGDVHHYERRAIGRSIHVIAGGGGAFLHGSRIGPTAGSEPPDVAYPDKATSLRLALGMPLRLAAGAAGVLLHVALAALAALQMWAFRGGFTIGMLVTALMTLIAVFGFTLAIRARLERPVITYLAAAFFGAIVGLLPLGLAAVLPHVPVPLGDVTVVAALHAFAGTFLVGVFLLVVALAGLEYHEGFAALGHPGFRHFVRLSVHPSGRVEGFVIGKDDPIGGEPPALIDHFVWE
jgi:hypothetical protein